MPAALRVCVQTRSVLKIKISDNDNDNDNDNGNCDCKPNPSYRSECPASS